ncbi:chromodomain-helicase-DNA-binding protein 1-like [Gordionus sp. m RMFG-2023]|uniref:chromodomain-helicase-DNA-binding protein 1-like n=1 Tax=Gordionus sp. m RMFG-2023 TaxID=3053472 RepID=UPI0031FBB113
MAHEKNRSKHKVSRLSSDSEEGSDLDYDVNQRSGKTKKKKKHHHKTGKGGKHRIKDKYKERGKDDNDAEDSNDEWLNCGFKKRPKVKSCSYSPDENDEGVDSRQKHGRGKQFKDDADDPSTYNTRRAAIAKNICYKEQDSLDEADLSSKADPDLDNEFHDNLLEENEEVPFFNDAQNVPAVKSIDKVLAKKYSVDGEVDGASSNSRKYQLQNDRKAGEMKFLIKWVGISHLHNTWETEQNLKDQEVTGIKKLDNFIRNEKELDIWKHHASPEDLEYYYCQKELSEDLLKQYHLLERIIAHKTVEKITLVKRRIKINASSTAGQNLHELTESIKNLVEEGSGTTDINDNIEDNNNQLKANFEELEDNEIKTEGKESLVDQQTMANDIKRGATMEDIEEEIEREEEMIEKENMYLCKWNGLPYFESTWEDEEFVKEKFPSIITEYEMRQASETTPYKGCKVLRIRPRFSLMKEQPDYMGNSSLILRDYQLDGVNWLARSWCKNNRVILADEMGLGKTIQVLSFANYLFNQHQLYGPYLIVAPLSTIAAWQKEASLWTPQFNTVVYLGDIKSRGLIQEYEWFHHGTKRLKFNLVLTTYELLLKDREFLNSFTWALLAVDEAHRLKNEASLLYRELIGFRTNFRLLITGTPLQNSLKELWALLHFIMPQKFDIWEDFEVTHTNADKSGYTKLHKELEPFILRRVKKDVEKSLPAKVEQILRVEMTSLQKQYYKWILTRNYKALCKGSKGSTCSFLNIVMELKKCCNHANLTKPELSYPPNVNPLQHLIRGSGKLLLLDKLLCRLKETGHRVLIFSQMVRMLDIIADYLQYRCFTYQRLDGSVSNELRRQALDHFNVENSQDFCFLLSTRAGGLGVNLATADTVIIFDSDWNPQNDLQAQARAHRIGQKNQVNIYRLVTKDSIEEEIIQRAKKKMVLDHLVIQRMNTTGKLVMSQGNNPSSNRIPFNKAELSSILKFGAEDLFKDEKDEEDPQVDIDDILKRAETAEEAPTSLAEELLSQFKVTDFTGLEEPMEQLSEVYDESSRKNKSSKKKSRSSIVNSTSHIKNEKDYAFDDSSLSSSLRSPISGYSSDENRVPNHSTTDGLGKDWTDIIPKDLRDKVEAEEKHKAIMELNKLGPRIRKPIYENLELDPASNSKKLLKKQQLQQSSELKMTRYGRVSQKRTNKNKHSDSQESYKDEEDDDDIYVGDEDEDNPQKKKNNSSKSGVGQNKLFIVSFSDAEIRKFVKSFRKFPNPQNRLEEIVYDAELQGKPFSDIKTICKLLLNNYREALAKDLTITNQDLIGTEGTFKLNQVSFPIQQFKKSMEDLECLYALLPKDKNDRKKFKLTIPLKSPLWGVPWTNEEDSKILAGVYEHGIGNWEIIKNDPALGLQNKILPNNNGNPKAKNLITRLDYLLKTAKTTIPALSGDSLAHLKVNSKRQKSLKSYLVNQIAEGTIKDTKKDKKDSKSSKNRSKNLTNEEIAQSEIDKDLPNEIFLICKEKMRPVKKALKQLDNNQALQSKTSQIHHIKACLLVIGNHIQLCEKEYADQPKKMKEWRNYLWVFVSKFTEYNGRDLHKFYKSAQKKRSEQSKTKSDKEKDEPNSIIGSTNTTPTNIPPKSDPIQINDNNNTSSLRCTSSTTPTSSSISSNINTNQSNANSITISSSHEKTHTTSKNSNFPSDSFHSKRNYTNSYNQRPSSSTHNAKTDSLSNKDEKRKKKQSKRYSEPSEDQSSTMIGSLKKEDSIILAIEDDKEKEKVMEEKEEGEIDAQAGDSPIQYKTTNRRHHSATSERRDRKYARNRDEKSCHSAHHDYNRRGFGSHYYKNENDDDKNHRLDYDDETHNVDSPLSPSLRIDNTYTPLSISSSHHNRRIPPLHHHFYPPHIPPPGLMLPPHPSLIPSPHIPIAPRLYGHSIPQRPYYDRWSSKKGSKSGRGPLFLSNQYSTRPAYPIPTSSLNLPPNTSKN